MRILEVLCNPRQTSFNRALAFRSRSCLAEAGHEVLFHDLYEEGFDPVLDSAELTRGYSLDPLVQRHCAELEEADGLLIFHPLWWGGPPAMLKGWMDRVLRRGVAYDLDGGDFSEKDWAPLLGGKKALVLVTSDDGGLESASSVEALWAGTVLGKCGMDCECVVLSDLRRRRPMERAAWMSSLETRLAEKFPAGSLKEEAPR